MGDKSRLLWRCRRGIREMDILFQEFIEQHYDALSAEERKALDKLLDEADLDILNWIMGKDKAESDELNHIVGLIQKSRKID